MTVASAVCRDEVDSSRCKYDAEPVFIDRSALPWGHATQIRGTSVMNDPHEQAVFAMLEKPKWAGQGSNLRPWD